MTLDKLTIISAIIEKRRTIGPSTFSGERIEDALVNQLLENANWAPNHRNTEPWRFKVYTQSALPTLAKQVQECYQQHCPEEKFSTFKMNKIGKKINKASHVIIICMQRHPDSKIPDWEELAAVSCAVQNLWLSATAANLAGYWSSPVDIIENASDFLSLREDERCLGLFYLGIPQADLSISSSRKSIETKIEWYAS